MKKINILYMLIIAVLFSFSNQLKAQNMENSLTPPQQKIVATAVSNSLFPKGEPNNPAYFTGEVYLQPLVSQEESDGYYSAGSVTFMPGARTNWHMHPSVQTLIVTEGEGWYQERDKEAVKLQQGSVIPIPVGMEHWHGASKDSKLVHIAITNFKDGKAVTWMSPVTDEEYNNIK